MITSLHLPMLFTLSDHFDRYKRNVDVELPLIDPSSKRVRVPDTTGISREQRLDTTQTGTKARKHTATVVIGTGLRGASRLCIATTRARPKIYR
jgi:hypothetical protein